MRNYQAKNGQDSARFITNSFNQTVPVVTNTTVRSLVRAPGSVPSPFSVEINGVLIQDEVSIDGINSTSELVLYNPVQNSVSKSRPGKVKYANITLTKDWSNTSEWFKWRKAVLDGKVDRRSISVIFHNDAGEEAGRYVFNECWPVAWTLFDATSPANTRSSGHAGEKLEISWETMELKAS